MKMKRVLISLVFCSLLVSSINSVFANPLLGKDKVLPNNEYLCTNEKQVNLDDSDFPNVIKKSVLSSEEEPSCLKTVKNLIIGRVSSNNNMTYKKVVIRNAEEKEYTSYVLAKNNFYFSSIPAGKYLLTIDGQSYGNIIIKENTVNKIEVKDMDKLENGKILSFFKQVDENGVSNSYKAATYSKLIRRIASTSGDKSFEEVDDENILSEYPTGVVVEDGKLIGLGIHILNEDVYPLQSFKIYLRNCGLTGHLDISDCNDMVFLDLYNNKISSVNLGTMKSMRILGLQNNQIESIDPTGLPVCQGIDIGKNKVKKIDVSQNPEIVELYINDNNFTEIDLSHNQKLKYFYCHNNKITKLDTTKNPLVRHMDATNNPMKEIRCLAPQRDEELPLYITADKGGFVGLKFNPVYNAQWKETGEWQQSYYAYPSEGYQFDGWYDENGSLVSTEESWIDTYGTSRILTAKFKLTK